MGVTFGSVQEEVANSGAGDMLVFRGYVGEDDAGCDFGADPAEGGFAEVFFTEIWEAEEPKDGFGDAGEYAEPGSEGCWFDLG